MSNISLFCAGFCYYSAVYVWTGRGEGMADISNILAEKGMILADIYPIRTYIQRKGQFYGYIFS